MGTVSKKPNIKFRLCSFKGNSILVEAAKVAANFKHLFFSENGNRAQLRKQPNYSQKESGCLPAAAA